MNVAQGISGNNIVGTYFDSTGNGTWLSLQWQQLIRPWMTRSVVKGTEVLGVDGNNVVGNLFRQL